MLLLYFCGMYKFRTYILIGLLFCFMSFTTQNDADLYETAYQNLQAYSDSSSGSALLAAALFFEGTPYLANTLETKGEEKLVTNLRELDCMTLVENALALSIQSAEDEPNFDSFKQTLQAIRYRKGVIEGYSSRLHYALDWLHENQVAGRLVDKSKELGGIPLQKKIEFMSQHPQYYPILQQQTRELKAIQSIEQDINQRPQFYIPTEQIPAIEANIQAGDLVFFVSKLSSLDVVHVGVAYRQQAKLHFVHASSSYKKVVVHPQTLYRYCQNKKNILGIIVCSPKRLKTK